MHVTITWHQSISSTWTMASCHWESSSSAFVSVHTTLHITAFLKPLFDMSTVILNSAATCPPHISLTHSYKVTTTCHQFQYCTTTVTGTGSLSGSVWGSALGAILLLSTRGQSCCKNEGTRARREWCGSQQVSWGGLTFFGWGSESCLLSYYFTVRPTQRSPYHSPNVTVWGREPIHGWQTE